MAFLVGVTINYSCGDSPSEPNGPITSGELPENPSLDDLTDAILALQHDMAALGAENEDLKEQIATLESKVEALEDGADGGDQGGDDRIDELETEVEGLEEQVATLESKVEALETSAGEQGGGNSGEFEVDGLWFNRGGSVSSKQKTYDFLSVGETVFYYDDRGRRSKEIHTDNDRTTIYTYTYSGKTMTLTAHWDYIDDSMKDGTSTIVYEYY